MSFIVTASSYKKNPTQEYKLEDSVIFDSKKSPSIEECKKSTLDFLRTWHTSGKENLESAEDFGVIREFFHVPPDALRKARLEYSSHTSPNTYYRVDVQGMTASTRNSSILTTTKKVATLSKEKPYEQVYAPPKVEVSQEPIQRAFANSNLSSFRTYYHNTVRESVS